MPASKNIFIFGDSITYGEWDADGGWANRIRDYYDSPELPLPSKFVLTYNLGIPSDTSSGVAERLTRETQSRISPNPEVEKHQFIIAIGTNDSRWVLDEKNHGVDKAQYKANLEDITAQAQVFSADILFVGLLPCVDEQTARTAERFDWDVNYKNKFIKEYNEVLKQHCVENNLEYIDLYEHFKNENIETLFDDGLHPNTKGHTLIFDKVIKHLD